MATQNFATLVPLHCTLEPHLAVCTAHTDHVLRALWTPQPAVFHQCSRFYSVKQLIKLSGFDNKVRLNTCHLKECKEHHLQLVL